ncbi:MAG: UDP-3-O-acyl-N-acetylglucosamine deacetylase, partial [Selenomonadaceae bacterium]|nr:UDP-3-O-acyl-N-acetylglucosamine deacetylase [Selenomonadaceae bacterium]
MLRQRTLRSKISCVGVGLHSGKEVRLELKPAEVDSGIIFLRTDLPERPKIHATAANVTATLRATTLEEDGAKVFT